MSTAWIGNGGERKNGKRTSGKTYKKIKFDKGKCKDAEISGTFEVGDVVFIHNTGDGGDWVAQIVALFHWNSGSKRVTLRWLYRHGDVPAPSFSGDIHPGQCEEELFFTDDVTPDGDIPVEVITSHAKFFPSIAPMNAYHGPTPKFLVMHFLGNALASGARPLRLLEGNELPQLLDSPTRDPRYNTNNANNAKNQ